MRRISCRRAADNSLIGGRPAQILSFYRAQGPAHCPRPLPKTRSARPKLPTPQKATASLAAPNPAFAPLRRRQQ